MSVQRVRIINQSLVDVPAEKAWEYLIDWSGTKRKARVGQLGELTLSSIKLEGGQDQIPRTRVMEFAFGVVRETLLHQDNEAMHLYYNIEGTGPNGLRNYLATTDVDPAGPSRCQITITARFDLDDRADVAKAKALIDFAHNQGVIAAIARYYAPK